MNCPYYSDLLELTLFSPTIQLNDLIRLIPRNRQVQKILPTRQLLEFACELLADVVCDWRFAFGSDVAYDPVAVNLHSALCLAMKWLQVQ